MDEVKIESRLLRGLVSRVIAHNIKKKFGYSIKISLNDFNIVNDDAIHAHLDINATMSKEELERILKEQIF